MNQWAFVIAAYALTGLCVMALSIHGWRALRRAEALADERRNRE